MKEIIRRTETIYKYSVAIYLFALCLSWMLSVYEWYYVIWDIWGSLSIIWFGLRLLRDSYVRNWCKWQKSSIIGVLLFEIADISFYGNYDCKVYENVEIIILATSSCFVIYFMSFENDEICKNI